MLLDFTHGDALTRAAYDQTLVAFGKTVAAATADSALTGTTAGMVLTAHLGLAALLLTGLFVLSVLTAIRALRR